MPICGDGVIWVDHETCDDQNLDDTDDCTNSCKLPTCGDGIPAGGAFIPQIEAISLNNVERMERWPRAAPAESFPSQRAIPLCQARRETPEKETQEAPGQEVDAASD